MIYQLDRTPLILPASAILLGAALFRFEKILYRPRVGRLVSFQVLQNTPASGLHTVNSDFFTSIGFTPMGGMVRLYKTRKGKVGRLLVEVLNIPPACVKTGKSQQGVRQMNAITRATAQSATSSTNNDQAFEAMRLASEKAATAQMFAEVYKAEALAKQSAPTSKTKKQARKHAKRRTRLELDSTWLPRVNQRARALSNQAFKGFRQLIIADLPNEPENWEYTELAVVRTETQTDESAELSKPRYHYPRSLLNQERFVSPVSGRAELSPSALVDDEFISPLLALLNQLRNDGHDITAPLDEAMALRAGLKKTVLTLEDIHIQALKSCYHSCEVSGGAK